MEEENWISLSGCNACINTSLCHHLGNCALLTVDQLYPDNNKKKRRYISKLRSGLARPDLFAQEMAITGSRREEKTYRTYDGTITLTRLEKMFIAELNKPR